MADFTDQEIEQKVIEIVAKESMVEHADITLETTPEELGIDSLGLLEIVFALEETFDINVPYNANDPTTSDFDLTNIGSVVAAVKKLIQENKGAA